jgi:hypothetical protein
MSITTIKLQKETKYRIEKLKEHKRETYEDLLRKMLGILNITKRDPEKARSIIEKIDETRARNFKKIKKNS